MNFNELMFMKAYKEDLSNGVIKFYIPAIKLFVNLAMKFRIETHHLKGLFVSFQKIRKFFKLDHQNKSCGCWKIFSNTTTNPV